MFKVCMNKKGIFTGLIIIVVLLVVGFFWFVGKWNGEDGEECVSDEECVAASCWHASECVLESKAPNFSGSFCSMVCSGPLDCGAGSCGCVDNKCAVVPNE